MGCLDRMDGGHRFRQDYMNPIQALECKIFVQLFNGRTFCTAGTDENSYTVRFLHYDGNQNDTPWINSLVCLWSCWRKKTLFTAYEPLPRGCVSTMTYEPECNSHYGDLLVILRDLSCATLAPWIIILLTLNPQWCSVIRVHISFPSNQLLLYQQNAKSVISTFLL